jgi:hypothetical protein
MKSLWATGRNIHLRALGKPLPRSAGADGDARLDLLVTALASCEGRETWRSALLIILEANVQAIGADMIATSARTPRIRTHPAMYAMPRKMGARVTAARQTPRPPAPGNDGQTAGDGRPVVGEPRRFSPKNLAFRAAIFANSDGCRLKSFNEIQRRAASSRLTTGHKSEGDNAR